MKQYPLSAAWLALFLVLSSLVSPGISTAGEAQPREKVRLKVALMPYLGFGILYLAEKEGFFAEQGIEVEFVRLDRVYMGLAPLIRGELDVLGGSASPAFLNAVARGGEVRIVADKGYVSADGCRANYLMVRKDRIEETGGLEDFSRMRGWKVAAFPAAYNEYLLDLILERGGIGVEDVEHVHIPYPAMPEAFERKNLDAAIVSEPWVTRIGEQGHAETVISAQEVTPGFQRAAIIFGPNLLRRNPEAGKRFMVAYLKAVARYGEGKTDGNVAIMAEHTGFEDDFLRKICWTSLKEDGGINVKSILDFQAWSVRRGFTEGTVTERQVWDPRFIEYANELLRAEGAGQ